MESVIKTDRLVSLDIREKSFPDEKNKTRCVLKDAELRINQGDLIGLIGPSGSGKTTILNILSGIDRDYRGEKTIHKPGLKISYVFQEPCLLPWKTVKKNLEFVAKKTARHRINDILRELQILDFIDYYPRQLSLGIARRVSIARALLYDARLVLMDEPFVSLDKDIVDQMQDMIVGLWKKFNLTVLFVTHDVRQALKIGQRIVFLGGSPAKIIDQKQFDRPYRERSYQWIEERHNDIYGLDPLRKQPIETSNTFRD